MTDGHKRMTHKVPSRPASNLSERIRQPGARTFPSDASIVLIGNRRSGKSSLALVLSRALQWKCVDADALFQREYGMSRGLYRRKFGLAKFRHQETELMRMMLLRYRSQCVIACGSGYIDSDGQQLLIEFANDHPVIHICRDTSEICLDLSIPPQEIEDFSRLLEFSDEIHWVCSNLTYYNISECESFDGQLLGRPRQALLNDMQKTAGHSSFTLRRVAQDFLHFVSLTTGHATDRQYSHSLASIPPEHRRYTYLLSISSSTLSTGAIDLEVLSHEADAIELQVDLLSQQTGHDRLPMSLTRMVSRSFAVLRRHCRLPVVYHVNRGNRQSVAEEEVYSKLIVLGLRLGAEYLTVDLRYARNQTRSTICRQGLTRIIGHAFEDWPEPHAWLSDHRSDLLSEAISWGCDMVRIVQPATCLDDNFEIHNFISQARQSQSAALPLIAYNTGRLGRTSYFLNSVFTPISHPALVSGRDPSLPPPLTLQEAQAALYSSFVLDPKTFYVFGENIFFSLTPAMMNAAFRARGMPHECRLHQTTSLIDIRQLIEEPTFGGATITLPYKQEVIPLLDVISPSACAIGAINTLIPLQHHPAAHGPALVDGVTQKARQPGDLTRALYGDNTDWVGIRTCIFRNLSPANAINAHSTGLVIGAGGMARAAIYAMVQLGVQNVCIFNRTITRAEEVASHYNRRRLEHGLSINVIVLRSSREPWPTGLRQPTVIISSIPGHSVGGDPPPSFLMPTHWLESPTGGVVVEVSRCIGAK
jgi:3-dehydroquinate dehydratase type I